MKVIREYTNAHHLATDIAHEMTKQFRVQHVEFDYDRFEKPGDIRFTFALDGMDIELYYSNLIECFETVPQLVEAFKKATT
ncbi:hypothetical protein [Ammoniphilus resinae]|uniref:Uncharacterized protein n=1 Tax=Ammoniphilus resinae TaxID=861532 RepID=A0ABS4GTX2_9BACL|nr:hypothetical protein [Ammoniphilus resinae]MBP1933720.1 hypothetical protein [Ammoniphilus resinae]